MEKIKLSLILNNKPKNINISEKDLIYLLDKKINDKTKKIETGIHFISTQKIKQMNQQYRNLKKPTNVLSFPIYKNIKQIRKNNSKIINLGDIFICLEIAEIEAIEKKINLNDYINLLIVHSLKHLIGIHHK